MTAPDGPDAGAADDRARLDDGPERELRTVFTSSQDPATTALPAVVTPASGIPLPALLSPDEAAAVAGLPSGSAMLVAHRGAQAGARFLLDAAVTTAGRDVAADILLDDRTVSRKHVEIHRTPTGFVVKDCGSLNGTYVNAVRVDEAVLAAGDELRIGKFRLTFHPSPADGATPTV